MTEYRSGKKLVIVTYWHGGRRGIKVGEFIVAPYTRKREWTTTERGMERSYLHRLYNYNSERDPKRVYVTTDRDLARVFASHPCLKPDGGGSLYRVRPLPVSSIEPDMDYAPTSYSARRAEVLEVAEEKVWMSEAEYQFITKHKYSAWEDGSPMYDSQGYMLPNKAMLKNGITENEFRYLGRSLPSQRVFITDDKRILIGIRTVF